MAKRLVNNYFPSCREEAQWLITLFPFARSLYIRGSWIIPSNSFQNGLSAELKSELACHDEGKSLDQLIELDIYIDNLILFQRQPQHSFVSTITAPLPPETEPMQIGFTHLNMEEREREGRIH